MEEEGERAPGTARIDRRQAGSADVLTLVGDVDIGVSRSVGRAFQEVVDDGGGPVLIDLSGVSFIDSTGLKLMLNLLRRLTRAGRKLVLVSPSPQVQRLLDLTALSYSFEIYPGEPEALAAVGA